MVRTKNPDSATCQFFIALSNDGNVASSLNGQYAAFGTIDETGMEVVDAIVSDCVSHADGANGTIEDISEQPAITSIVIAD